MDMRSKERAEDLPTVETPEDVAVLYSWANLHGAKYRDFSASRREYRAQLRHRAAEQAREQELRAQASAETSASVAEDAARKAEEAAMSDKANETEYAHQIALRQAEEASRVAAAERIEAARRAEAVNVADAAARREEREMAEASASARRQAARYADSELRRRNNESVQAEPALPGQISDPYTPQTVTQTAPQTVTQPRPVVPVQQPAASSAPEWTAPRHRAPAAPTTEPPPGLGQIEYAPAPQANSAPPPPRRPQGYRPDDASGVRQIYRGPEFDLSRELAAASAPRQHAPTQTPLQSSPQERTQIPAPPAYNPSRRAEDRASAWSDGIVGGIRPDAVSSTPRPPAPGSSLRSLPAPYTSGGLAPEPRTPLSKAVSPFSQNAPAENLTDPVPRRRRQDAPGYKQEHPSDSNPSRRRDDEGFPYRAEPQSTAPGNRWSSSNQPSAPTPPPAVPPPAAAPVPSAPAWLYASVAEPPTKPAPEPPQSSVSDTLQHSRERVASRWYALKGVFDQPGQETAEPAPVRQKETRTPILAVFSMAGGVGKTSLVATLGRSLSSLGEKVLLTDTTSHGLLPFYFGASELRQGTVRTFSPPSGSTDAPIYLVSYDVEQKQTDEAAQDALVEEITGSSRGTHRVLLDLNVSSGWIIRRMARLNPTVLIPVAPDMNSVISLQAVEKYFDGVVDSEGRPLKLFYLLNQFDASLPLHLDIREVLRRQLGERLLPFVIRRAPAVGEALAEGMTIVDYSPEAPVAEDYLNAATWLRTVAAPATAGFRNVRWSER